MISSFAIERVDALERPQPAVAESGETGKIPVEGGEEGVQDELCRTRENVLTEDKDSRHSRIGRAGSSNSSSSVVGQFKAV